MGGKAKTEREILGFAGAVRGFSLSLAGPGEGTPLSRGAFDAAGRLLFRECLAPDPLHYAAWFRLDQAGREVFSHDARGLSAVERYDARGGLFETERFHYRAGDRLMVSELSGPDGAPLGSRSLERDYKGNIIAVKLIGPDRGLISFDKIEGYKQGSPALVTRQLPTPEGGFAESARWPMNKDGLPERAVVLERDRHGNWILASLDGQEYRRSLEYEE